MEQKSSILRPEISVVAQCHTCLQTISVARETCPYCGISLRHEDLVISAVNSFVINQAITSANTILTLDRGVFLSLGVSVFRYFAGYAKWLELVMWIPWLFPLVTIALWFHHHGKWDTTDKEYLEKRQKMKSSLYNWSIANAVSLLEVLESVPMNLN